MNYFPQAFNNAVKLESPARAPAVPILIAVAMAICVTVLLGWFSGLPLLRGFGRSEIFMQPWTAIGGFALLLSVFLVSTRRTAAARWLLILPFAIASTALFQEFAGTSLGVDRIFFAENLAHQPRFHPGRPGLLPATTLWLLSLATLAAASPRYRVQRLIPILACLTIALAFLSGALLPLGYGSVGEDSRYAVMSYPTAIVVILTAFALLLHYRRIAWPVDPRCGLGRDTVQLLLLLCVLLPILTSIWQLQNAKYGLISHELAEIIEAAVHVAASCAMTAWAWVRISRESATRWAFRIASDTAPIAITDIYGQIIHWSKGCERLYGWHADEVRGRQKYDLTDAILPPRPDDGTVPLCPREAEITERRRDGSLLHIIETRQVVHPRSDIAPMVVLSMTDITQRKRRTEMLEAREAELRTILDTVPDAMMTLDDRGRIRTYSAAAEKLFGYAADEIVGQGVDRLLPEYAAAHAPSRGTGEARPTSFGLDRDGRKFPVEIAQGITLVSGKRASILFVRSLSEQIAAQARLDELRSELLHAARLSAMGEMGAVLAHELNQPLTATANFLGAASIRLDLNQPPEQIRELVDHANGEVLRAGEIIRHMRAFVTKGDLQIRALPLDELIADALHLARSGARHMGVALHYYPGASSPRVLADRVQVQQLLVNIIGNAMEALGRQATAAPAIDIHSIERDGGDVLVRIVDNGPGFTPAILEKPTEAFVSTRRNGIGLGLSISRRIVEGHSGSLSFGNRQEGGAVVEFTLPTYREAELQAAQ